MKHKLMFGLQVFTTLILFMAIFVTYIERSDVKASEGSPKVESTNAVGSNKNLSGILNSTFTTSLTGIISCGK